MKKFIYYLLASIMAFLPIFIFIRDYILKVERKGHLELSSFAGIVIVAIIIYVFQNKVFNRKAQAKDNLEAFGKKSYKWKHDIYNIFKLSFILGMLCWFTSIVSRFSADMYTVLIYIWICEVIALVFLMLAHIEADKKRD